MLSFKDKQKTLFSRVKNLREKATPSELLFKTKLDSLKIKYIFQKSFIVGNNYCIVDFYLPKPYKTCIEIDGEYHSTPTQIKRDFNRDVYLRSRGFKVIRIPNDEVSFYDLKNITNV